MHLAHRQLDRVPRSIAEAQEKLAALDGEQRRAAERLRKADHVDQTRQALAAERATVRHQLDEDARARGGHLAADPPPAVLERLGPRPAGTAAATLWLDAAGRVAQHQAAFEQDGTTVLGRRPQLIGDYAYGASYWSAAQAIDRLDRALGRRPAIEPPS